MINLCLVVIATQFAETKRRETERMLQERKRMQSSASFTSSDQGGMGSTKGDAEGGDSVYAAIVRMIGHWSRQAKRIVLEYWDRLRKGKRSKKSRRIESKERKGSTTLLESNSPKNSISNEISLYDHSFQGHEGQRLNGSVKSNHCHLNISSFRTSTEEMYPGDNG